MKVICENKRAYFEYFILDKYEAGIALVGSEVKSAKLGHMNLSDSFCKVVNGEIYLKNCFIAEYKKGSFFNEDPKRDRKLLLHKAEIRKIARQLIDTSTTLVALKAYFSGNKLKLEIAVVKGKKMHDKRDDKKQKDLKRETDRLLS